MFTLEQINDLHERLGSAKTFPEYVRALKALGVERCDSYLADGRSEYFSQGGQSIVSPPVHEAIAVAETSQREAFLQHLSRHEQRAILALPLPRLSPIKINGPAPQTIGEREQTNKATKRTKRADQTMI